METLGDAARSVLRKLARDKSLRMKEEADAVLGGGDAGPRPPSRAEKRQTRVKLKADNDSVRLMTPHAFGGRKTQRRE